MKIVRLLFATGVEAALAHWSDATSDPLSLTTPAPVYPNAELLARYPETDAADHGLAGLAERAGPEKRQAVQTCALINNNMAFPLWCPPGSTCVFDTVESLAGCCVSGAGCPQMTACMPYTSSAYCGTSCQRDPRLIKCFNPAVPDCVTISMYNSGVTLRHYDCGTLGAAGIYYATWFSTPAVPVTTPTPSPQGHAGSVSPSSSKGTGGGDTNQAVGGNGGNVNGNGNTVIYNSLAGVILRPGWQIPGIFVVGSLIIVLL